MKKDKGNVLVFEHNGSKYELLFDAEIEQREVQLLIVHLECYSGPGEEITSEVRAVAELEAYKCIENRYWGLEY